MELKQIEYFLQLAQTQHVSRTADLLHIAQPTLSKSLASLEQDLGIRLFDRIGNRLKLNAGGQRFYESAKQAMQTLNSAVLMARRSAYEVTGSISISCLAFAPILTPCISDYMELNPHVHVQLLQYHRGMGLLNNEEHDFILYSTHDTVEKERGAESWVSQPLFTEDCYFVIGPAHPRYGILPESPGPIDLTFFADASFSAVNLGSSFADFTYNICQRAGFVPRSFFNTDDFLVEIGIVREGLAVTFLPESCLEEAARLCPGLRWYRISQGRIQRNILMLRKKRKMLSETSLDFWNFLLEHYQLPKDERD